MLVQETLQVGESVGEFIWRIARERILTEEYTDQVGAVLSSTLAAKMPLQKFFPWKTIFAWVMDRFLPEYGMVALREVLGAVKLINPADDRFHIPGVDEPLPEIFPQSGGNG